MRRILLGLFLVLSQLTFCQAQQEYRTVLTPKFNYGAAFQADFNFPTMSASLRFVTQLGGQNDVFNLNLGIGYRGFFDSKPPREFIDHPSFSDYMLYNNDQGETGIRPMGGQLIVPAELHLNAFRLGESTRLFLGVGAEYGIRVYQSHRYERFYGAHVMRAASMSFYPMLGIDVMDDDDGIINFSLFWRYYSHPALNGAELDIDKFTARGFGGIQLTAVF